jgi:peptidyl-dipeptidase A
VSGAPAATAADFLKEAEARLLELSIESSRADWVQATYITDDTTALANRASARLLASTLELAKRAARFPPDALSEEERRKIHLLRTSLPMVAPDDPRAAEELAGLVNEMQAIYARARVALPGVEHPLDLEGLERRLATGTDPEMHYRIWRDWHETARPMRPSFVRYVALGNEGARTIGFSDMGEMWRSGYDMSPAELDHEVERLWQQLLPFYRELHAYARGKLRARYGEDHVPAEGPIPAHLLGNMWAQSWEHLYGLLVPAATDRGPDLTRALVERGTTPRQMVEYAERFFLSLGLPKLPESFWTRSMFVRPEDRDVVCHASAWDIDFVDDLRIKMCIDITAENFRTIHHELGHNYYQRAYAPLPFLYRASANDGFHEAIGDTIALSVTPEYLRTIGLSSADPGPGGDLGQLLARALESIAFLPFGLLVDRWRWRVFDGTIRPDEYNPTWWEHRRRYQGIAPMEPRPDDAFDPGAKYHVAANVPYLRYFLAQVLQFQFHRALARAIGASGPLHRASIFGHREAGARLEAMLALGASRPWPEALATLTGEQRLDATAILDYFAPLREFLAQENRGAKLGW